MNLAPILVFCFKRKKHLQDVIDSLIANPESKHSDLFIYSDAAKNAADSDKVMEVRNYIKNLEGFKSVTIIEREVNFGLARSIIDGVSEVVQRYGKVIVLEDDTVTSNFFLRYMNEMLVLYQDDSNVASIHGYVYPIKKVPGDTFFIKGADCWGWATWSRAWRYFEPNGQKLLDELVGKKLQSSFNFDNSYPYVKMLEDQISGKNNSWAIRWNASAFLKDMYTLYPAESLVKNIGFDDSGTHCSIDSNFDVNLAKSYVTPIKIPIEQSEEAYKAFRNYFLQTNPRLPKRILNKLKRVMRI